MESFLLQLYLLLFIVGLFYIPVVVWHIMSFVVRAVCNLKLPQHLNLLQLLS